KYSLLIFLSIGMIYSSNVKAQSALNLKAYGVWSRGDIKFDPDDPNYDYLLGMSAEDTKWSALQPTDSLSYDWSAIQNSIDVAAERNSKIYIGIGPGPESPLWIYENGVPKVYTIESGETTHDKWPFYPFYLDPDYKRFFLNFIEELGNFIFNQPPEKFKTIAFLQVKTGCTGDEVAYKGDVIDPQYELPKSGTLWSDFRLMVFEKYREVFLTGEKKVPLLFNAIDPEAYPTEWNWLITKIGDGFGVKQGALVRGHHLSNERIVVESWNPYLVNPKGLALFSRSEMDQTWKKPLYQINVELGFYWGVLNGLNQGLSVWDLSSSALKFAGENNSVQNSLRFFNKY
ncbi:MAG: hypothetical protein KAS71_05395, partial [Bacteroidales bacterium]|nr:hypothetical protein [Bacteroidales bacterium]